MNKPIRAYYDLAQQRIRNGEWRVEPEQGLLYGVRGRPFTGKRHGPHGGYVICTVDGYHAILVHRVIWEFVNGPIPEGLVVNHLNGIKADNRISNIEVVTFRENNIHAYRTGLMVNKKRAATECPTHGLDFWTTCRTSDRPVRAYCKECHRLRAAAARARAKEPQTGRAVELR